MSWCLYPDVLIGERCDLNRQSEHFFVFSPLQILAAIVDKNIVLVKGKHLIASFYASARGLSMVVQQILGDFLSWKLLHVLLQGCTLYVKWNAWWCKVNCLVSTSFSSELLEDMKIFCYLLLEIVLYSCLFLCKLMFFLLFKLRVWILGEVKLLILLKFLIYTMQCLTYQLKQF